MDDEDFVGVSDYFVADGENVFLCLSGKTSGI